MGRVPVAAASAAFVIGATRTCSTRRGWRKAPARRRSPGRPRRPWQLSAAASEAGGCPGTRPAAPGLAHRLTGAAFLQPVLQLTAATAALSAGVGFLPVLAGQHRLGPGRCHCPVTSGDGWVLLGVTERRYCRFA